MPHEFTVIVPSPDGTEMGPAETFIWDTYGEMHNQAVTMIGADMAFSILLSRAAREVRRRLGTEAAKAVFTEMARTMDEAAKYDR